MFYRSKCNASRPKIKSSDSCFALIEALDQTNDGDKSSVGKALSRISHSLKASQKRDVTVQVQSK